MKRLTSGGSLRAVGPGHTMVAIRLPGTPDEPHWNKDRNTGALKGTWEASLPYDGQKPLPEISKQIARKIHRYALKHLAPNPTLPGSMKWRRPPPDEEHLGQHLAVHTFSLFQYYPTHGRVLPHVDTDTYSRCVSAALYLNNNTVGGKLRLLRCKEPHFHEVPSH